MAAPGTSARPVIAFVQPSASAIDTSCGRGPLSASVMKVGAPLMSAKADSIQFVRTLISRP